LLARLLFGRMFAEFLHLTKFTFQFSRAAAAAAARMKQQQQHQQAKQHSIERKAVAIRRRKEGEIHEWQQMIENFHHLPLLEELQAS